jgi:hypothetical protein
MEEPISFLLDADVAEFFADEIIRLEPTIEIWIMGDEPAPPRSTLDPEVLLFAEQHARISGLNSISPHSRLTKR